MKTFFKSFIVALVQSVDPVSLQIPVKTEELYEFVTGILALLVKGSLTNLNIEIKDDNDVIFKNSMAENWVKTFVQSDKINLFRPCNIPAKGRNIWIRIIADSVAVDTKLEFVFRHEHEEMKVIKYNFEEFDIEVPYPFVATAPIAIDLPNQYDSVRGICAKVETGDINKLDIALRDNSQYLLPSIPAGLLAITTDLDYDKSFFEVDFEAKGKRIYMELVNNDTIDISPATTIKVKLLMLFV